MIHWFRSLQSRGFPIPLGTPTLTLQSSKVLEANDGNDGDNDGWFGRQSCIVRADNIVVRTVREGSQHASEEYGIVHISFSDDWGETWSALDTYLDGSPITGMPMRPAGAGNPSGNQRGPSHGLLTLCPNGDLLVHMWSSNYNADNDGPHQSRSTDGGRTWSSPARIAISNLPGGVDDDRVFFGEGHTVVDGVIYACIRNYEVSFPQQEQSGVAVSADNGLTWTFRSWTTTTTSPSPRGTQEQSIEYVGKGRFVSLLREAANQDGHFSYSTDYCATWSSPVDVTAAMGIGSTQWLGRQIMMTRAHLQRKGGWWKDRVLIVTGFMGSTDNQSTNTRRNGAWVGIIPEDYDLSNITWYGPYWLAAAAYDGGYGCPFWNPVAQEFVQLSYISPTSLYTASSWQFNFKLTFPKNLFWEGNSLSAVGMNNEFTTYYIPTTVYTNVTSGDVSELTLTTLPIGGQNQTQINAKIPINIQPYAKPGDIIVLWEGTNDMYTNGLSGEAAYANLETYANVVKSYGCKLVVCTVLARDYVSDPGDLMTRIGVYNSLVKAQDGILFDAVVRLDEDSHFDARADASNTTYYNADKLHQATAGQNLVITMITTKLLTLL